MGNGCEISECWYENTTRRKIEYWKWWTSWIRLRLLSESKQQLSLSQNKLSINNMFYVYESFWNHYLQAFFSLLCGPDSMLYREHKVFICVIKKHPLLIHEVSPQTLTWGNCTLEYSVLIPSPSHKLYL